MRHWHVYVLAWCVISVALGVVIGELIAAGKGE
jgi:hypothetical protein